MTILRSRHCHTSGAHRKKETHSGLTVHLFASCPILAVRWRFGERYRWYPFSKGAKSEANRRLAVPQVCYDINLGRMVLRGMKIGAIWTVMSSSVDRHVMDEMSLAMMAKCPDDPGLLPVIEECVDKFCIDIMRFTGVAYHTLNKRFTKDQVAALLARGVAWETVSAGRPCDFYPWKDLFSAGMESSPVEGSDEQYWLLEKWLQEDAGVKQYSWDSVVWKISCQTSNYLISTCWR